MGVSAHEILVKMALESASFRADMEKERKANVSWAADMTKQMKSVGTLLRGGGALRGVKIIAGEMKDFANAVRDSIAEFQKGKINAGEMVEKIATSIPLLGKVWEAGRSIKQAFWDTTAAIAGWAGASQKTVRGLTSDETLLKNEKESAEGLGGIRSMVDAGQRQQFAASLKEKQQKEFEAVAKHLKNLKDLRTQYNENREKANAAGKVQSDAKELRDQAEIVKNEDRRFFQELNEIRAKGLPTFKDFAKGAHEIADGMREAAHGAKEFGQEVMDKFKDATDFAASLKEDIATLGMDDAQKKLRDAVKDNALIGATGDAQRLTDQFIYLKKVMKDIADMKGNAARWTEATRTPLEKFKEQIADLDQLFFNRFIDKDTYGRGLKKAQEDIFGERQSADEMPHAIERRFDFTIPQQKFTDDPQRAEAKRLAEAHKAIAERQRQIQDDILKKLRNLVAFAI
jgi:hypothetical protein